MDYESARAWAQNVIDRLILDETGRGFRLDGLITIREMDALRHLIETPVPETSNPALTPEEPTHTLANTIASEAPLSSPPAISKLRLNIAALSEEPDAGLTACVDFGTAFSKAAVWEEGKYEPVPLDLESAGTGQSGFTIPSSVYITEGSLFFGARALEESRRENNRDRERFDSPKQCLSIDDPEDIDRERVNAAVDPTRTFTRGELLRLYLAYLSSSMGERLEAHGFSRYTARRFAIPVWRGEQLTSASLLLRKFLTEAQIVADSIDPDAWTKGVPLHLAKQLLSNLSEIPEDKIVRAKVVLNHVLEPLAAVTGITDYFRNEKPRILVADIGAGTSDFGAYQFVLPREGHARAHPFAGSESALKQAGNRLDEFLIRLIVQRSGTPAGSDASIRITKALMRDIRETKQKLFTSGTAFVSIPDLLEDTITIEEFSADHYVRQFARTFRNQVIKTIEAAGPENFTESGVKKYAVLTGGGATLPMIRQIFSEPLEVSTGRVSFRLVDPTPHWVRELGNDVLSVFPQLAVATGGASPELVEERMAVSDMTEAPRRSWGPRWT